jgi:hypothetical protein
MSQRRALSRRAATDRVRLIAQRGWAGHEDALARAALPELDDLKLLLANTLTADGAAAAVWARAGRLV